MPDRTTQALWYVGAGRAEIRNEPLAEPGPGEVRVRALHSAISRGTESLVLAGRVPPSEFERMRAPFMGGSFPFPVKYGYATVGRVEAGPAELLGRIVFALHPHQSLFNVPLSAVVPLPDGVPPARAVLAANMETALNAVWDAAPGPADRIAIVGAGVVGALVAFLCGRLAGAQGDAGRYQSVPRRTCAHARRRASPRRKLRRPIATSSSMPAARRPASRPRSTLAGFEATVLELSWYGDGPGPGAARGCVP